MRLELAKIEAKTGSGEIEFAAPAGAKFEMSAKSRRGGVENDYGAPLTESSHDRSGIIAGVVGTGGPRIVLETGRGEIRVRKASELERPPAPPKPAGPGKLPAEAPVAPRPPLERSMQ